MKGFGVPMLVSQVAATTSDLLRRGMSLDAPRSAKKKLEGEAERWCTEPIGKKKKQVSSEKLGGGFKDF